MRVSRECHQRVPRQTEGSDPKNTFSKHIVCPEQRATSFSLCEWSGLQHLDRHCKKRPLGQKPILPFGYLHVHVGRNRCHSYMLNSPRLRFLYTVSDQQLDSRKICSTYLCCLDKWFYCLLCVQSLTSGKDSGRTPATSGVELQLLTQKVFLGEHATCKHS